jgi:hypothetical protein
MVVATMRNAEHKPTKNSPRMNKARKRTDHEGEAARKCTKNEHGAQAHRS